MNKADFALCLSPKVQYYIHQTLNTTGAIIVTRIFLAVITLSLLTFPASVKAQELSDAQKAEIEALIKSYLLENGETVIESVNKYQEKQAEEQQAEAREKAKEFMKTAEKSDEFPVAGNVKGDVTIVEFFDYNCGYCRRALEEIQKVIKKDDNVKVVLVDMPILGPSSTEAAKWSLAAENQGKYWEYHTKIMNFSGEKNAKNLEKIAKDIGLDVKQLKKDKDSEEIEERLNQNIEEAQKIGIRGTPGFIIGDDISPGFMPSNEIHNIVKKIRSDNS